MAPPAKPPGLCQGVGSYRSFCLLQLNYLVPATCCIIILFVFDLPAYTSPTNFPAVLSLFLLYGYVSQRGVVRRHWGCLQCLGVVVLN